MRVKSLAVGRDMAAHFSNDFYGKREKDGHTSRTFSSVACRLPWLLAAGTKVLKQIEIQLMQFIF
jgi:hypothetical protein